MRYLLIAALMFGTLAMTSCKSHQQSARKKRHQKSVMIHRGENKIPTVAYNATN